MPETTPDTTENPQPPATDTLNNRQKWLAGILLIGLSSAAMLFIIAYWPDRLPETRENLRPLYIKEAFHVRLACIPAGTCCIDSLLAVQDSARVAQSVPEGSPVAEAPKTVNPDSGKVTKPDTTHKDNADTGVAAKSDKEKGGKPKSVSRAVPNPCLRGDLINLNVLLLALVAAAGFLGNMIHISTSFTTFIGAGTFKKSWLLWYCVKPFTASALAIAIYFVFRGGFLNYSADASSINLYGVLTLAILAGLFTDKATLKLAEVFDVVFSVKKDGGRPDPLQAAKFKFDSATPDHLAPGDNVITLSGENFDKGKFSFTMNDVPITTDKITLSATKIVIRYTVPAAGAAPPPPVVPVVTQYKLLVLDQDGKTAFTKVF